MVTVACSTWTLLLSLGRVAVCTVKAAYSHRPSCKPYVALSVCPVDCGKTPERIRMLLGMLGRTGPWMRAVVRFGDRSTGRVTLGANMGRPTVTNGGLFTNENSHWAAARLLPAEFLEPQVHRASEACRLSARCG